MTLPVPIVVALTLLREIVRVFALPWHATVYLLRRDALQHKTRELLSHWQAVDTSDALATFLRTHPPQRRAAPHLFLSAGEASGEMHAARLLHSVRAGTTTRLRVSCFGGDELAQAGGEVLVPLVRHAIIGVSGVLKSIPFILSTFARFLRLLRRDKPDLVVLVDYPGLHLVMAKAARRAGVPVIHYVAPQYWGWAPWRMARYRGSVDACLAILPFEPAFYRNSGVPCEYVGNPLIDRLHEETPDRRRVAELQVDRWLCLLPGSRRSEIARHLPGMLGVAAKLRAHDPDARFMVAHRDPRYEDLIRSILAEHGADFVEFALGEVSEKLVAARVALVKSGTGSLETALAGTPSVVVYRMGGRFMHLVYRNYLTVPWFAAANLISARNVVPERCFITDDGWEWAANEVVGLWDAGEARLRCLDQLADVPHRLGEPGASARAAVWVLAALGLVTVEAT